MARAQLTAYLGHYPDAARVAGPRFDVADIDEAVLRWAETYQAPDDLRVVMRWYARRFPAAPEADSGPYPAGKCAFYARSKMLFRLAHTTTALLCPQRQGTRIAVNEAVYWLR